MVVVDVPFLLIITDTYPNTSHWESDMFDVYLVR